MAYTLRPKVDFPRITAKITARIRTRNRMYGIFPTFPPIRRKPSVLDAEILPPLPSTISAIPRKIICVANVTIIGGSSSNCVRIKPLTAPQTVPTISAVRITTINGAPVLHIIQLNVADRHTVAPTEISISPSTRIYAIGIIKNTSARYTGI